MRRLLGELGQLDIEADHGVVIADLHEEHLGSLPACLCDRHNGVDEGRVVQALIGAVYVCVVETLCFDDVTHVVFISLLWSVVRDVRAIPEGGGTIPPCLVSSPVPPLRSQLCHAPAGVRTIANTSGPNRTNRHFL